MIELRIEHQDKTNVGVHCSIEGVTDELIDEIAAGLAAMIVEMAADYKGKDDICEPMIDAISAKAKALVFARRCAEDKPEEA